MKDIDQILNDLNLDSGTESFEAGTEANIKDVAKWIGAGAKGLAPYVGAGVGLVATGVGIHRLLSRSAAAKFIKAYEGEVKSMTKEELKSYRQNFSELTKTVQSTASGLKEGTKPGLVDKMASKILSVKPTRLHKIKDIRVMTSIIQLPKEYADISKNEAALNGVLDSIREAIKNSGNALADEVMLLPLKDGKAGLSLVGVPFRLEKAAAEPAGTESIDSLLADVFGVTSGEESTVFNSFEEIMLEGCKEAGFESAEEIKEALFGKVEVATESTNEALSWFIKGSRIGAASGAAVYASARLAHKSLSKKAVKTLMDSYEGDVPTKTKAEFKEYKKNFEALTKYVVNNCDAIYKEKYATGKVGKAFDKMAAKLITLAPTRTHKIKDVKVMTSAVPSFQKGLIKDLNEMAAKVDPINECIKNSGNPLADEVIAVYSSGILMLKGLPFRIGKDSSEPAGTESIDSLIDSVFGEPAVESFNSDEEMLIAACKEAGFESAEEIKEVLNLTEEKVEVATESADREISRSILEAVKETYGEAGLQAISDKLTK